MTTTDKKTKPRNPGHLTYSGIANRWKVSVRTVQRIRKAFDLKPVGFDGAKPVFAPADVERIKEQWTLNRLKRFAPPEKILSVREAKRMAGRGK